MRLDSFTQCGRAGRELRALVKPKLSIRLVLINVHMVNQAEEQVALARSSPTFEIYVCSISRLCAEDPDSAVTHRHWDKTSFSYFTFTALDPLW